MEQTLSIIKPDGVTKNIIGEIIKRFEASGIKIIAMKMTQLTKTQHKDSMLFIKNAHFLIV